MSYDMLIRVYNMKIYTHRLALRRSMICVLHHMRDVETKPCCPCLPLRALKELSFNPPFPGREFVVSFSLATRAIVPYFGSFLAGLCTAYKCELLRSVRWMVQDLDSPRPRDAVDSRWMVQDLDSPRPRRGRLKVQALSPRMTRVQRSN